MEQYDRRPLPERGYDRVKAERIAAMFMHRYQPPVACPHTRTRFLKVIAGVHGAFRVCQNNDCRMVVGVVR